MTDRLYLTTAIPFVNGAPHLGHALEYVQTDVDLNNLLQSVPGDWRYIYDVAIVDVNGKALLHTNASLLGKVIEPRPDFEKVVHANFREQIRLVFSPAAVYDVT